MKYLEQAVSYRQKQALKDLVASLLGWWKCPDFWWCDAGANYNYAKIHWNMHFMGVDFMIHKFHLNNSFANKYRWVPVCTLPPCRPWQYISHSSLSSVLIVKKEDPIRKQTERLKRSAKGGRIWVVNLALWQQGNNHAVRLSAGARDLSLLTKTSRKTC